MKYKRKCLPGRKYMFNN